MRRLARHAVLICFPTSSSRFLVSAHWFQILEHLSAFARKHPLTVTVRIVVTKVTPREGGSRKDGIEVPVSTHASQQVPRARWLRTTRWQSAMRCAIGASPVGAIPQAKLRTGCRRALLLTASFPPCLIPTEESNVADSPPVCNLILSTGAHVKHIDARSKCRSALLQSDLMIARHVAGGTGCAPRDVTPEVRRATLVLRRPPRPSHTCGHGLNTCVCHSETGNSQCTVQDHSGTLEFAGDAD